MTDKKLKIRQQAFALTLCTVVFMIVYNVATWYASSSDHYSSFTFDIETSVPFVPLSIIPYMASGFFFCLVFFSCKNKYQLKILTWRMLFVIMIAGIIFISTPLRFSFTKPEVSNGILNLPFLFLKKFDSPFNQSPSLHIVFAFIFWSVFRELRKWRIVLMISLILVGISTLTTYQHHLIDILTGAILAHISFLIIPYREDNLNYRHLKTANYYFLSGWILVFAGLMIDQFIGKEGMLLFLPALATFIIGYFYQNNIKILSPFVFTVQQNIRQFKKN